MSQKHHYFNIIQKKTVQPAIIYSKLTIEALEERVNYVQS